MFKQLGTLLVAAALAASAIGVGLPAAPVHAAGPLNPPIWPNNGLQRVVIHNLYMDNNWDAHNPSSLSRATIDDFTGKLLVSGYFSKAAQYGVYDAFFTGSDQAIAACPAPGPTFDYTALSSWILCEKHNLPAYSANGTGVNIWQVYVPLNASLDVSFTWPQGGTVHIVQNCQTLGNPWSGFHALTLPSVVPPDGPQVFGLVPLGCNGGSLTSTTLTASHELIEAATDPNGLAWGTVALTLGETEAADLCEGGSPSQGSLDNGRYRFAAYWSNADGGCVVPGNGATFATVPNVLGSSFAQAATTLRAAGFLVSSSYVLDPTCESVGLVVGEQPGAGALTQAGSYVTVKIAKAPSTGCF
jgi:hypothetical protein